MEPKLCIICGEPRPPRRRTLCGSPECKLKNDANIQRAWQQKYREANGRSSTRVYDDRPEYRAKALERAARRGPFDQRQKSPEVWAAKDARRRERIRAVSTEPFTREEIADRDGWTCWLCDEPIDPKLKFPERFSCTLDHVLPIARGGEHSRENCRVAHLRCNSSKRDRIVERGDPDGRQAKRTDRPQDSREAPLGVDHV